MNLGIIGGREEDYARLDEKLNELIEIKGTYLFNIVCSPGSLGDIWGTKNGSGKIYFAGTFDEFIKVIDYAIVFQDASVEFNPVLEKLKRLGKHGSVLVR